jgi:hypothetical protein
MKNKSNKVKLRFIGIVEQAAEQEGIIRLFPLRKEPTWKI